MLVWLLWILALSVFAFAAYGIDKRRAIRGRWRISEKFLLTLGFVGGAVGALIGMRLFHHKTRHTVFWVVNIIGLILHIAIIVLLALPA